MRLLEEEIFGYKEMLMGKVIVLKRMDKYGSETKRGKLQYIGYNELSLRDGLSIRLNNNFYHNIQIHQLYIDDRI